MTFHAITEKLLVRDKELNIKKLLHPNPNLDAVLPPHKIAGTIALHNLSAVMISISRDAFTLAMALERLEDNNFHTRHIVIDRDGTIYHIASLMTALKYLEGFGDLNYSNTVSIELINYGRINVDPKNLVVTNGIHRHRINSRAIRRIDNGAYYEIFNYYQYDSLRFILSNLRMLYPALKIVNCAQWESQRDYGLTPVFPFRHMNYAGFRV